MNRRRIAAVLTTLGVLATGLVTATPAAQADSYCTITNFTPRKVVVGLSPVNATFKPTVSGCTLNYWTIDAESFYVYSSGGGSAREVFNPYYYYNDQAGAEDASVEVENADWDETDRIFRGGFSLLRRTQWDAGTFNASPEPVKKGKSINITGRLRVVDWDNDRYIGYSGRTVSVQFRTATGSYTTVKTAKTSSTGWLKTTVKASKTGTWRVVYWGNAKAASATSVGDTVKVS
jgi:hypothetical protein